MKRHRCSTTTAWLMMAVWLSLLLFPMTCSWQTTMSSRLSTCNSSRYHPLMIRASSSSSSGQSRILPSTTTRSCSQLKPAAAAARRVTATTATATAAKNQQQPVTNISTSRNDNNNNCHEQFSSASSNNKNAKHNLSQEEEEDLAMIDKILQRLSSMAKSLSNNNNPSSQQQQQPQQQQEVIALGKQLHSLVTTSSAALLYHPEQQQLRNRIMVSTSQWGLVHIALDVFKKQIIMTNHPGRVQMQLPSEQAQEAVCRALRQLGRVTQLRDTMQRIARCASSSAISSSSSSAVQQVQATTTTPKVSDTSGISLTAFNIFLACLCDPAVTKKKKKKRNVNTNNWSLPPQHPTALLQEALECLLHTNNDNDTAKTTTRGEQQQQQACWAGLVVPDVVSYNTVMTAAATYYYETNNNSNQHNHNRTTTALLVVDAVWQEMKNRNVSPDAITYNALLKSRSADNNNNNEQELLNIWNEMRNNSSVHPDRYTLHLVLPALLKAGRIGDAESLLDRFVAENSDVVVSQTFEALLSTLVVDVKQHDNNVASARALFETYISPSFADVLVSSSAATSGGDNKGDNPNVLRFVTPRTRHFNILIEGYRKQAAAAAVGLLDYGTSTTTTTGSADAVGVDDDGDDPNQVYQSLCDEAWGLFRTMKTNNIAMDAYTATSLIGICQTSDALTEFLAEVVAPGDNPGITISSAVLRAACTQYGDLGDPSSACWIFSKYVDAPGSTRYWNVLLGALARGAEMDNTGQLDIWNSKASKISLRSDSDSKTVLGNRDIFQSIDRLCCADAASRVSDQIARPNSQTFCILAKALQYNNNNGPSTDDANVANELFRKATARNISADGRFINAALRCFGDDIDSALKAWTSGGIRASCVRRGDKRKQQPQAMKRATQKNLVAAYNGLLHVCGRASRPDIALRLIFALKKEGLEPDEVSLNSYKSGASIFRSRSDQTKLGQRLREKLKMIGAYESLLEVECLKYDENDDRRKHEKRVRIIL